MNFLKNVRLFKKYRQRDHENNKTVKKDGENHEKLTSLIDLRASVL